MKTNIFFPLALLGIIIFLTRCGNASNTQGNVQIIELEFERGLTIDEQNIIIEVITQRLGSGKISFTTIELIDDQNFTVGIKSETEKDRAMKLLTHQGLFSIMEVFDSEEVINDLIEINDELRFEHGLKSSILDFIVLLDSNDDNMPFESAKTVIGLCNPEDTLSLMQLLHHSGIKEMLPKSLVFRWMKEKYDEKLQLVALKLEDEGMQINQNYISSVKTEENNFGQNSLVITLNPNGTKHLQEVTKQNTGKHLAIMFDNVVHALVDASPIHSGRLDINQLSQEELEIYSNILSAGQYYPANINALRFK